MSVADHGFNVRFVNCVFIEPQVTYTVLKNFNIGEEAENPYNFPVALPLGVPDGHVTFNIISTGPTLGNVFPIKITFNKLLLPS